jgi:hypothetical protein
MKNAFGILVYSKEYAFLMEKRYQGKWSINMLSDYCWSIIRDVALTNYKQKLSAKKF